MHTETTGTTGTAALSLKGNSSNMVENIFEAFKILASQGELDSGLTESAQAADPILKKITGKGFFDYLQDKMFNKHGKERLARLVRVHKARLQENMPQQSIKFFSGLAKKINIFIDKTPILKQVFESVKSVARAAASISHDDVTSTPHAQSTALGRGSLKWTM